MRLRTILAALWLCGAVAVAQAQCVDFPQTGAGTIGSGAKKESIEAILINALSRHRGDQTSFLGQIDYRRYLEVLSFRNHSETLDRLRREFNKRSSTKDLGDRFVLLVADTYYREFPADYYKTHNNAGGAYRWLEARTEIGSYYVNHLSKRYGASDTGARTLYELVGTYSMFQVATHIDAELAAGRLIRSRLGSTLEILKEHGVPVGTPKGDVAKAWEYFRRGDFEKLLQRTLDAAFSSHYKEIIHDTYHARSDPDRCGMAVRRLVGTKVGEIAKAYILDRRRFSVRYAVRSGDMPIPLPKGTVLSMSASYTDEEGIPTGFTVLGGEVKNGAISRRMDALVIADAGTISILDLRNGAPCGQRRLQPFTSLPDYFCMMRCASRGKQSIFQTHLLYYAGTPALDPTTAPVNPNGKVSRRERRILVTTPQAFVILDIPIRYPTTLAEATFLLEKALDKFGIARTSVQAAVNLDTGTFDILDVICPEGRVVASKASRSHRATNLLIFTQP